MSSQQQIVENCRLFLHSSLSSPSPLSSSSSSAPYISEQYTDLINQVLPLFSLSLSSLSLSFSISFAHFLVSISLSLSDRHFRGSLNPNMVHGIGAVSVTDHSVTHAVDPDDTEEDELG